MISGGRRNCIAKSNGRVEIEEKQIRVARLGTLQKGTKKIWASFVICGDIDFYKDFDFDSVDAGKVFEVRARSVGQCFHFTGLGLYI